MTRKNNLPTSPGYQNKGLETHISQSVAASLDKICAVVKLDYQMHALISTDEGGNAFFEGDLSLPKWQQGSAYALALARLIEQVVGLASNSIQCRLRVIQVRGNEVNPQIVLVAQAGQIIDQNEVKTLAREFANKTSSQMDLLMLDTPHISDVQTQGQVSEMASLFLLANGGQRVHRQLQICVNDEDVATIKGQWKLGAKVVVKESTTHYLKVFYDGRRLRSRTLFLVEAGSRAKSFEIYYDEDKFDQQLREFQDSKNVALEISVLEEWDDKNKARLTLATLKRIEAPSELDLE